MRRDHFARFRRPHPESGVPGVPGSRVHPNPCDSADLYGPDRGTPAVGPMGPGVPSPGSGTRGGTPGPLAYPVGVPSPERRNPSESLDYRPSGTPGPAGPRIMEAAGNAATLDAGELRARYEERAAVFEFDGGLPRPEAELRAWIEVALDVVESDPAVNALGNADARRAAARVLSAAGIPDPEAAPLRLARR